jgi:4-hydroxy-tetrahydrodipicolinate synthase
MHISGGWACSQMIEALDRGVHAFAVTAMSEVYCKIIGLYRQGRRDDASALFKKLLPAIAFSTQHLDISICFYKRLMWRQGLYKTPNVRHTTYAFDAYHIRVADELIDEVIGLTYEVKSGQYY